MAAPLCILGIETSCDETAAAVYDTQRGILSSALFSQIELHKVYGGVIPEIASRSQIEKIGPIVQEALHTANVTLEQIDYVAVTTKPGLAGSLLVGLTFAKAIAWAKNIPLIGVNHLEGHAFSPFIENPTIPFPHLCLTASGGHTSLYKIDGFGQYTVLGGTLDDAAGEAFDKIAKLLNLPYPGGVQIERWAESVEFKDFFKYPRGNVGDLDFSFSGLKTAVLYDLIKKDTVDPITRQLTPNCTDALKAQVASSLLVCIKDMFVHKLKQALKKYPVEAITFAGGVACNKYIKQHITALCAQEGIQFFAPSARYCTDNAAMIAFVGAYNAIHGHINTYHLDIF
jgi:N6-L-threonylcarbamoyladenine synthase